LALINHCLNFYVNYIIQSNAVKTGISILNICGAKPEKT